MKQSPMRIVAFIIVVSLLFIAGDCVAADAPAASDCDRECLLDVLDAYLDALAANDPSRIDAAGTLKYTENGVTAQLGRGLWTTATSIDNEKRLDFADPQLGNVATQVVVNEGSGGGGCGSAAGAVIYQVRLKVVQHVITEIESMVVRRRGAENGFFNINNMEPQPVFNQPIPPSQSMSRAELVEVIGLYMDYLEGKKQGAEVPFNSDCARYENGVRTANGTRAFARQSFWQFDVTRRYLVIDEEAGIVWGMFPFEQTENSLVVGEAFKVVNGEIMMIQAVMDTMPAKAWD